MAKTKKIAKTVKKIKPSVMDKVKIKRVKRTTKKATTKEKILAGLGVGSTLLGGANAVNTKAPTDQFVRTQSTDEGSASSRVKSTLQRVFGVEKAQAAEMTAEQQAASQMLSTGKNTDGTDATSAQLQDANQIYYGQVYNNSAGVIAAENQADHSFEDNMAAMDFAGAVPVRDSFGRTLYTVNHVGNEIYVTMPDGTSKHFENKAALDAFAANPTNVSPTVVSAVQNIDANFAAVAAGKYDVPAMKDVVPPAPAAAASDPSKQTDQGSIYTDTQILNNAGSMMYDSSQISSSQLERLGPQLAQQLAKNPGAPILGGTVMAFVLGLGDGINKGGTVLQEGDTLPGNDGRSYIFSRSNSGAQFTSIDSLNIPTVSAPVTPLAPTVVSTKQLTSPNGTPFTYTTNSDGSFSVSVLGTTINAKNDQDYLAQIQKFNTSNADDIKKFSALVNADYRENEIQTGVDTWIKPREFFVDAQGNTAGYIEEFSGRTIYDRASGRLYVENTDGSYKDVSSDPKADTVIRMMLGQNGFDGTKVTVKPVDHYLPAEVLVGKIDNTKQGPSVVLGTSREYIAPNRLSTEEQARNMAKLFPGATIALSNEYDGTYAKVDYGSDARRIWDIVLPGGTRVNAGGALQQYFEHGPGGLTVAKGYAGTADAGTFVSGAGGVNAKDQNLKSNYLDHLNSFGMDSEGAPAGTLGFGNLSTKGGTLDGNNAAPAAAVSDTSKDPAKTSGSADAAPSRAPQMTNTPADLKMPTAGPGQQGAINAWSAGVYQKDNNEFNHQLQDNLDVAISNWKLNGSKGAMPTLGTAVWGNPQYRDVDYNSILAGLNANSNTGLVQQQAPAQQAAGGQITVNGPQVGATSTSLTFKNLTANDAATLAVGDNWTAAVTGPSGKNVYVSASITKTGSSATDLGTQMVGTIGADGTLTVKGSIRSSDVGSWKEIWKVGDSASSSQGIGNLNFSVIAARTSNATNLITPPGGWAAGTVLPGGLIVAANGSVIPQNIPTNNPNPVSPTAGGSNNNSQTAGNQQSGNNLNSVSSQQSGIAGLSTEDKQVIAQLKTQISGLQNKVEGLSTRLSNNSAFTNSSDLQAANNQITSLKTEIAKLQDLTNRLQNSTSVHAFASVDQFAPGLQMPTGYSSSGGLQMPSGYGASQGGRVAGAQTAQSTYTVKKGDTLWSISKRLYGDGTKWRKILEANTSQVKNPRLLQIGSVLVIPQL